MVKISQALYIAILILTTTLFLTLILVYLSKETAKSLSINTVGTLLLTTAMNEFEDSIIKNFGRLDILGGELVDEKQIPIRNRFEVVDYISQKFGVNATIFVTKGGDFECVSTSVKKSDGSRAVGTLLGSDSVAYKFLKQNQSYLGLSKILGEDFITFYKPILNENGKVIGVYFVGKPIKEIYLLIKSKLVDVSIKSLVTGIFIGVIAALISIVMNYYIFSKTSGHLSKMISEISSGNLKISGINITSPIKELQTTANALKNLSETISGVFIKTKHSLENLSASAQLVKNGIDNLSTIQTEFFGRMEEITKAIQSISASAQQVASNVAEFSTAAQRLSSSAVELSKKTVQMKSYSIESENSVKAIADVISETSKISEETEKVISQLNAKTSNIKGILETISSIAEQTNLLALNAAIEAARAGEAGRGFAVVADEIRKLAEESKNATAKISAILNEIVHGILKAGETINETVKVAQKASQKSEIAREKISQVLSEINHIAEHIELLTASAQQFTASTEEMSSGVNAVSRAIEKITTEQENLAEYISNQRQIGQELSQVFHNLSQVIEDLRENIKYFKY